MSNKLIPRFRVRKINGQDVPWYLNKPYKNRMQAQQDLTRYYGRRWSHFCEIYEIE